MFGSTTTSSAAKKAKTASGSTEEESKGSFCHEVTYEYFNEQGHPNETILALIDKMTCSELDQLYFSRNYYPAAGTIVRVAGLNVELECMKCNVDRSGDLVELKIIVRSYQVDSLGIRRVVNQLVDAYRAVKSSGLRDTRYFFEQQPFTIMNGRVDEDGNETIDYNAQLPYFRFRRYPLVGSVKLDNLYGDECEYIRTRVREFLENRAWYEDNGFPYTLGLLLSGPPGTGKTSLIKAIARETNRHVIMVKLFRGISRTQLERLFKHPAMCCLERPDTTDETWIDVPLQDRLYVFEEADIDCGFLTREDPRDKKNSGDIPASLRQEYEIFRIPGMDTPAQPAPIYHAPNAALAQTYQDQLSAQILGVTNNRKPRRLNANRTQESLKPTLADFLTIIDGPNEIDGHMIIMTSNQPEKLDPALVRPGRLEHVRLGNFKNKDIMNMMTSVYKLKSGEHEHIFQVIRSIPDDKYSAAAVTALIRTFPNNPLLVAKRLSSGNLMSDSRPAIPTP